MDSAELLDAIEFASSGGLVECSGFCCGDTPKRGAKRKREDKRGEPMASEMARLEDTLAGDLSKCLKNRHTEAATADVAPSMRADKMERLLDALAALWRFEEGFERRKIVERGRRKGVDVVKIAPRAGDEEKGDFCGRAADQLEARTKTLEKRIQGAAASSEPLGVNRIVRPRAGVRGKDGELELFGRRLFHRLIVKRAEIGACRSENFGHPQLSTFSRSPLSLLSLIARFLSKNSASSCSRRADAVARRPATRGSSGAFSAAWRQRPTRIRARATASM